MHYSALFFALSAYLLDTALAHGYVSGIEVNGAGWTPGADPVWYYYAAGTAPATAGWNALNQDNGFVAPDAYQTDSITCHKSATPGQLYVNANAGDTLTLFWNTVFPRKTQRCANRFDPLMKCTPVCNEVDDVDINKTPFFDREFYHHF
jgi:hypothetical protein